MSFTPVNKKEKKTDDETSHVDDEELKRINDAIDSFGVKVKDSQVDPEFIKKHQLEEGFLDVELKKAKLRSITPDQTELIEPCLVLPLDAVDSSLDDKASEEDVEAAMKIPEGDYLLIDPKTKKKHRIAIYDTVFKTDLRTLVNSQFYDCPATVFPRIAERLEETARKEKEAKFPDRRSDKKDYFWLMLMIMIPVLVVIAFTLF